MNVKHISPDLWGDGARDMVVIIEDISPDPWGGWSKRFGDEC